MHTVYFLTGLSLGSTCGLLLALLLLHSRAQSLAEEMVPAQREEEFVHEDEETLAQIRARLRARAATRAASQEWMRGHSSAAASGIAK